MKNSQPCSARSIPQLELHRSWLRTVISARVEDAATADDLLQETMMAALRNCEQLQEQAKLAPWLYRIAVRQVLLHRRTQGRQRKLVNGYAAALDQITRLPASSNGQANPQEWLLRQESQAQVRAALRALPRRDREVLLLKYEQDWNYQQISEHLGLTREAVKFRLLRARKRLRAWLTTQFGDETHRQN